MQSNNTSNNKTADSILKVILDVLKQYGEKEIKKAIVKKALHNYAKNSYRNSKWQKPVLSFMERRTPVDFFSFFVPPNVKKGIIDEKELEDFYNDAKNNRIKGDVEAGSINCFRNQDDVRRLPNLTILYGSAGTGKSTLMKYLFLEKLTRYLEPKEDDPYSLYSKTDNPYIYPDQDYLPVFIELYEFCNEDGIECFDDLVVKTLIRNGLELEEEDLREIIRHGKLLYFLDGYDEITSTNSPNGMTKNHFQKWVKDNYCRNNTILFISTRLLDDMADFNGAYIYSICPLSRKKAQSLLETIDLDDVDDEEKKGFRDLRDSFVKKLQNGFYEKNIVLTSNPLFLNLMFKNYTRNNISDYELYGLLEDIFKVLYDEMWRFKKVRQDIKLGDKVFENILSLFCYLCYKSGRLNGMEEAQLIDKIEEAKNSKYNIYGDGGTKKIFNTDEFIVDLLGTTILRRSNNNRYFFSHILFQEYFTMVFLSREYSDEMGALSIDLIKSNSFDATYSLVFNLLYQKAKKSFKNTIIYPLLLEIEKTDGMDFTERTTIDTRYDYYFKKMITSLQFEIDPSTNTKRMLFGELDPSKYEPINFIVRFMEYKYTVYENEDEKPTNLILDEEYGQERDFRGEYHAIELYVSWLDEKHKKPNGRYELDYNELFNNKDGYDALKNTWVGERVFTAAVLSKAAREKRNKDLFNTLNNLTIHEKIMLGINNLLTGN